MGDIAKDLTGQRFGSLIVLRRAGTRWRQAMWLCRCDCGRGVTAVGAKLRNGHTSSCGCSRRNAKTHGHAVESIRSPTYTSWRAMNDRCTQHSHPSWKKYGARGITVCERWRSFENFLADMGERPEGTSLDRINGDSNYEPGNCRWSTVRDQNRNRSITRRVTHDGLTLTLAEWSERTGIKYNTLRVRLARLGWSPSRALSEPVLPFSRNSLRAVAP